jgi:hypothetical protein
MSHRPPLTPAEFALAAPMDRRRRSVRQFRVRQFRVQLRVGRFRMQQLQFGDSLQSVRSSASSWYKAYVSGTTRPT